MNTRMIQPFRRILGAASFLVLALPAAAQDAQREVTFINTEGTEIGTAALINTNAGVLIELDLRDLLPETWHGFHIHENGECNAQGGFESAGGHFAISDTEHGYLVEGGPHSGDMPNQYVAADGTLKVQVLNTYAWLGGDQDNITGRALMIHSGDDDYKSQPSGEAGDRIACAVIE